MTRKRVILRGKQQAVLPIIPLVIEVNNLLEELRVVVRADRAKVRRSNRPKIQLNFAKKPDGSSDYKSYDSEISFRIMDRTNNNITLNELSTIARRIMTVFAKPTPFAWKKGRQMISYSDWEKGYQLQILCRDRTEGRRVVDNILKIRQENPQWEYANFIANESPDERYPANPGREQILGQSVDKEEERPLVDVTFKSAIALLGTKRIITLVDLTGKLDAPLVQ